MKNWFVRTQIIGWLKFIEDGSSKNDTLLLFLSYKLKILNFEIIQLEIWIFLYFKLKFN